MSIQTLTNYFLEYGAFFHLSDRAFGISESSGISGGGDHAAFRDLGISG